MTALIRDRVTLAAHAYHRRLVVDFDVNDFSYLGRTSSANSGIFVWETVEAETLTDVREEEVILGASGKGSEVEFCSVEEVIDGTVRVSLAEEALYAWI